MPKVSLAVPISLLGFPWVLTIASLIFTEAATAQTVGVCGLTIPQEYKGHVITEYGTSSHCPPGTPKSPGGYNEIVINPPYSGLVICGFLAPSGYFAAQQRYMPDCNPNGDVGDEDNAIVLEKGSVKTNTSTEPSMNSHSSTTPKDSSAGQSHQDLPNSDPSPQPNNTSSPPSTRSVVDEVKDKVPGVLRGLFR